MKLKLVTSIEVVLLVLFGTSSRCVGWRKWTDSTDESDLDENETIEGRGPKARRGHSLVMHGDRAILFGGKGRDFNSLHVPKTFELVPVDGKLEFASYDQNSVPKGSREILPLVDNDKYVEECLEPLASNNATKIEQVKDIAHCNFNGTKTEEHEIENYIPITTYFNDVWAYDLTCDRYADAGCVPGSEGWSILDPGARLGGCYLIEGSEVCSHPNERYAHGAQIINDEFLVIFGGFSQFCQDFCDDAWLFVLPELGEAASTPGERWVELKTATTPGKRWKAATTLVDSSRIILFGGHRLWHGFSKDNSRSTRYSKTDEYPNGGYLDDMWEWDLSSCRQRDTTDGSLPVHLVGNLDARIAQYAATCVSNWTMFERKRNCSSVSLLENGQLKPGYTWEARHDMICHTVWPQERAGHGILNHQGSLYMFGGYRTFFPYPHTRGAGAGPGSAESSLGGEQYAFPDFSFYLDDLWKFDLGSGYWFPVTPQSSVQPASRMEMAWVATEEMLILFGGYHGNHYFNDMWYFDPVTSKWLEKKTFVHPRYPENCTEGGRVVAYPTAGTVLDGKNGRLSEELEVNLTRRQAPGWDGCRDRDDGRKDMPWELQWEKPLQRSHLAATYAPNFQLILAFGGHGFDQDYLEQVGFTHPVEERGDLWQYRLHQCVSNCSMHGDCWYGFCTCHSGYYGLDCSNTSCPGDFCYYDEETHEQICRHCCHAPHRHSDNDVYIADLGKESCSLEDPGTMNGICDGNGQCLCVPPFIGLDCSIKDCPNKCSNNGWCSEEYPVSRCICDPGYTGHDCSHKECINNCSYPNGICVDGECQCRMWKNPYDRERDWRPFMGMDCSFIIPFAHAQIFTPSFAMIILIVATLQQIFF